MKYFLYIQNQRLKKLFNFSNIWAQKINEEKIILSSYEEFRLYDLLNELKLNILFITYPEKRWIFDITFLKGLG